MNILFKLIRIGVVTAICASLIILASVITEMRYATAMKIINGCRFGSYLTTTVSTGIFSDGMTVKCRSLVIPRIDEHEFLFELPQEKEEPKA